MKHLPEIIVHDESGLRACCEDVAESTAFGFDTEFVGEDRYVPDLCLLQVATAKHLYVIDPFTCGPLDAFWRLVVDPSRVAVVHAGREEARICHGAIGKAPGNLYDVQIAAGLLGLGSSLGYAALAQTVLRKRLTKGQTLTDWRKRPLTKEQIRYAFDDVRELLALWVHIDEQLGRISRRSWAKEEFEHFTKRALKNSGETERWRKLKGTGNLSARRLATVREIYLWRDAAAAGRNRPVRSVLRDDLIVEIAKRDPESLDDIASTRGIGRADVAGVFDAVKRAHALSPDEWPDETERDNDSTQVVLVASLMSVVLGEYCLRQSLTPAQVATSADLRKLVRAVERKEEMPEDCGLTYGWRKDHVLPFLLEILHGKKALRVKSLTDDYPLEYGKAGPRQ